MIDVFVIAGKKALLVDGELFVQAEKIESVSIIKKAEDLPVEEEKPRRGRKPKKNSISFMRQGKRVKRERISDEDLLKLIQEILKVEK